MFFERSLLTISIIGILWIFPLFAAAQKNGETIVYDNTRITLPDVRTSRIEREYKVIIPEKNTQGRCVIQLPYDKFTRINFLKVRINNPEGKTLKQYSLKDCQDHSLGADAVASDSRMKYLEITASQYPCCIEVEYRIDQKGSMFYPTWYPLKDDKETIQSATLTISDLQNIGFRHREYNMPPPQITPLEKGGKQYVWEVKNTGPIPIEPLNYQPENLIPVVFIGACNFEMDGYAGNMESWTNLGKWINLLSEKKNNLAPEDINEVKKICAHLQNPTDKVKAIYRYVQQNSRYVSIQLGIGGWQPLSTRFVHEKKYGDCKALSFYTKSLLEAVGIPAYYTIIRAKGDAPDIIPDFPLAAFNHIIVTVPLGRDTMWLECTSNINPPGYIGTFTSGRHCLMVDEQGGHLIKTRSYSEEENRTTTKVHLELIHNLKDAAITLQKTHSGLEIEKDDFLFYIHKDEREKKKWIEDHAHYGTLELQSYRFFPLEGGIVPVSGFEVKGTLKGFCQQTNNHLFIAPFRFTQVPEYKDTNSKRKTDFILRYPFIQSDSVYIRLSPGTSLEQQWENKNIETPFGYYRNSLQTGNNQLLFIRTFCLKAGQYPPSAYPAFCEFIRKVEYEDRICTMLIKE